MLRMLPRSIAVRSNAFVARRVIHMAGRPMRLQKRFQSTGPPSGRSPRDPDESRVSAGVVGGLTVVLAGYIWYRSYPKTSRNIVMTLTIETPGDLHQTLSKLREYCTSLMRDIGETLDEFNYLYDAHSDEMNCILEETVDEVNGVTQDRGLDAETIWIVSGIIEKALVRMIVLGGTTGNQILDGHPILKEKLGSSFEQLQNAALQPGFEWMKILRETTDQMKELVAKNKLDENSIAKVREHIQMQTSILLTYARGNEIGEFFGWNMSDRRKKLAQEARSSAKGTVSGVLPALGGRGEKAKGTTERTGDESEK